MKIYFEDGKLNANTEVSPRYIVDASNGYSENKRELDRIKENDYNSTVYTNQIIALSNEYCWNENLGVPELYLRVSNGKFKRADELTDRELRQAHNLEKLYVNGGFNYIK